MRDRFCLPIVSFHHVSGPHDMRQLGELMRRLKNLVQWHHIWNIYQRPAFSSFHHMPVRYNEDYVGGTDLIVSEHDVRVAFSCLKACDKHHNCPAWTWDTRGRSCSISPWMIAGDSCSGKVFGIHATRAQNYLVKCNKNHRL
ncbi:family 31 glycosyltransferase [Microthyrium microscopicum]|uniref:Family 31 glycosyltransferase n=1 Tax=Microthyrium microscopicum TaxID=703497 RepID=A0A6A6TUI0_9PEZI|nr:family 31 glycosyltransferase [Microthyrium microscopicum]